MRVTYSNNVVGAGRGWDGSNFGYHVPTCANTVAVFFFLMLLALGYIYIYIIKVSSSITK